MTARKELMIRRPQCEAILALELLKAAIDQEHLPIFENVSYVCEH